MVATVQAGSGPAVVRVSNEHAGLLADFYRQTWDGNATATGVLRARALQARRNPHGRDVEVPTFVFLDGERAVGHLTTIPIMLWNGREEVRAHWLKGLMVLPQYRNGPVGFMLVREALRAVDCSLAAVVAPDARRLFTALGFADIGTLGNSMRILDPKAVLQRLANSPLAQRLSVPARTAQRVASHPALNWLAASALSASSAAFTALRGRADGSGRIAPMFPDRAELAELWTGMRHELRAAPSRGPEYLEQRYGIGEGYRWIVVRRDGKLCGFAAVRPPGPRGDPRLNGVRVATLAEVIARPNDRAALLALLQTAEQVARGLDAHVFMCSASHSAMFRALRQRAYLPYPGNVHVLVHSASKHWPQIPDWWLTRGDSAADEAF